MVTQAQMRRTSGGGTRTVAPDYNVSLESSNDEDVGVDDIDWRQSVMKLQEENDMLRRQLLANDVKVAALKAKVEGIRVDVITRSQKVMECDQELYKRISEFTKKTLFRHIKFITSNDVMNNLECKTSLANITMNHFDIDVRDRIMWWRACSDTVSDAIGTQRNQVNQAVKAQVLKIKAKANKMQLAGTAVPGHMTLPELQEILKMRPSPMTPNDDDDQDDNQNDIMTFTFVAEYLVGAVLGKKEWDRYKCRDRLSTRFTLYNEAYLYVILSNSYDLWRNAEGSRVGNGSLTKDGTNKKYCGWTREGIQMYNNFMQKVKENCLAAWAHDVEEQVTDTLKPQYDQETRRHTLAVRRHRKKRRMRDDYESDENECDFVDIDAKNDLSIAFAEV